MKPNRPELALLRGKPKNLEEWVATFGEGSRDLGRRYGLAVATFLGKMDAKEGEWNYYVGQLSPHTKEAYSSAIEEFFEWAARKYNRVVPPHRVKRQDAEEYVHWLANRDYTLVEEKLKDGDQQLALAVYQIVKEKGVANQAYILKQLASRYKSNLLGSPTKDVETAMSEYLGSFVQKEYLTRSPSLEQIRQQYPSAGIRVFVIEGVPLYDVFQYRIPEPESLKRTSIANRLAALSTFWRVLQQGENFEGGEPILKHDIWQAIKERVTKNLSSEKRLAASDQRADPKVIIKLLKQAPSRSLTQKRDRAILYFMAFVGVRQSEVISLRRGKSGKWPAYYQPGEPSYVNIMRKGQKEMRIPYPPIAQEALAVFQNELRVRAAPMNAQMADKVSPNYIPPGDSAWVYRDLQLPEAPLFPPIALWGKNNRKQHMKGLTRSGLFKLLKRTAREAGLTNDEVEQIHPHALRHFAANAMVQGGKDIREVQAILGHTSITTTEGYLEDITDLGALSGQNEILDYIQKQEAKSGEVWSEGQAQEVPPPTDVIETYAAPVETVTEEQAPPAPATTTQLAKFVPAPANNRAEAPEYTAPIAKVVETSAEEVVVPPSDTLVGVADDTLVAKSEGSVSSGSPGWVYESLLQNKGQEDVELSVGTTKDFYRAWDIGDTKVAYQRNEFLRNNYDPFPLGFGLGKQSLLPWYARGKNVNKKGYVGDIPPLPLLSSSQTSPETTTGERFLLAIEKLYNSYQLTNPARAYGLLRWWQFFAYQSTRYQSFFVSKDAREPNWVGFSDAANIGEDVREHEEGWILSWLEENAHTYRVSAKTLKQGGEDRFWANVYEGLDLVTNIPDWMAEDDPIAVLGTEWPNFREFIANIVGIELSSDRQSERDEKLKLSKDKLDKQRKEAKAVLEEYYELLDSFTARVEEDKQPIAEEMMFRLLTYALVVVKANPEKTKTATEAIVNYQMETMDRVPRIAEFERSFQELCDNLGIPNPREDRFILRTEKGVAKTDSTGKKLFLPKNKRIRLVLNAAFPQLPKLEDPNQFQRSVLFDKRYFKLDDKNKTIFVSSAARKQFEAEYGQDPDLLVRRASRAMFEAHKRGTESKRQLHAIMLSYFAWVVPSGAEMEKDQTGSAIGDMQSRLRYIRGLVETVKELSVGSTLRNVARRENADLSNPKVIERFRRILGITSSQFDVATDLSDLGAVINLEPIDEQIREDFEEAGGEVFEGEAYLRNAGSRGNYIGLANETNRVWLKVNYDNAYRSNPPTYVSHGASIDIQRRFGYAFSILPSPFKMMQAIGTR